MMSQVNLPEGNDSAKWCYDDQEIRHFQGLNGRFPQVLLFSTDYDGESVAIQLSTIEIWLVELMEW